MFPRTMYCSKGRRYSSCTSHTASSQAEKISRENKLLPTCKMFEISQISFRKFYYFLLRKTHIHIYTRAGTRAYIAQHMRPAQRVLSCHTSAYKRRRRYIYTHI